MTYRQITLLFALLLGAFATFVTLAPVRWPHVMRSLPRDKRVGGVLGSICLLASAFYVLPMLEGDMERFRPLVVLAVPVLAILCHVHLDYLFARAFGGILILGVNYMLHMAFVVNLPNRLLYAVPAYALAICGMVLIACPWRLRDLMEKAVDQVACRHRCAAVLGALCLFYVLFGFVR